jgi:hypothetical protein
MVRIRAPPPVRGGTRQPRPPTSRQPTDGHSRERHRGAAHSRRRPGTRVRRALRAGVRGCQQRQPRKPDGRALQVVPAELRGRGREHPQSTGGPERAAARAHRETRGPDPGARPDPLVSGVGVARAGGPAIEAARRVREGDHFGRRVARGLRVRASGLGLDGDVVAPPYPRAADRHRTVYVRTGRVDSRTCDALAPCILRLVHHRNLAAGGPVADTSVTCDKISRSTSPALSRPPHPRAAARGGVRFDAPGFDFERSTRAPTSAPRSRPPNAQAGNGASPSCTGAGILGGRCRGRTWRSCGVPTRR